MSDIAIENGHRNSGSTHWKWWLFIVMLVYQRLSEICYTHISPNITISEILNPYIIIYPHIMPPCVMVKSSFWMVISHGKIDLQPLRSAPRGASEPKYKVPVTTGLGSCDWRSRSLKPRLESNIIYYDYICVYYPIWLYIQCDIYCYYDYYVYTLYTHIYD